MLKHACSWDRHGHKHGMCQLGGATLVATESGYQLWVNGKRLDVTGSVIVPQCYREGICVIVCGHGMRGRLQLDINVAWEVG